MTELSCQFPIYDENWIRDAFSNEEYLFDASYNIQYDSAFLDDIYLSPEVGHVSNQENLNSSLESDVITCISDFSPQIKEKQVIECIGIQNCDQQSQVDSDVQYCSSVTCLEAPDIDSLLEKFEASQNKFSFFDSVFKVSRDSQSNNSVNVQPSTFLEASFTDCDLDIPKNNEHNLNHAFKISKLHEISHSASVPKIIKQSDIQILTQTIKLDHDYCMKTPPTLSSRQQSVLRSSCTLLKQSVLNKLSQKQFQQCQENIPSSTSFKNVPYYSLKKRISQSEDFRIVYIGGIENGISHETVYKLFHKFGPIVNINLHFREQSFGFITFANEADACKAVKEGPLLPSMQSYTLSFANRRSFWRHAIEMQPSFTQPDFDTLLEQEKLRHWQQ